nr:40S ribosomal protein S2-4-like [Tanacetum cinerariifolium]
MVIGFYLRHFVPTVLLWYEMSTEFHSYIFISREVNLNCSSWKSSSRVIPVRRGYWGNKIGKMHNAVTVWLVLALRGAEFAAARVPKKVMQLVTLLREKLF